jgi:predicted TIM-barrel fold metal-dependent hydrolase
VARIDAHVHLLPAEYAAELDRRDLLSFPLPPWDPEMTHRFMDRHAIDAAVMSLSPPGVAFGDAGLARHLARMVNEQTAELVGSDPARFAGLAVLPLPDTEAAIDEARHALDVLGLDGVALLSNVEGIYPGAPEWAPLFDELDARGAYVFLHPTTGPGAPPLPQYPVWLHEFPFDTTRALVDLIYSGTLERCRGIRLQVAHLGGAAPFLAHRVASLVAREPERAALAPDGALAYLSRLYYDTGLANNGVALATARAVAPFERILFGTDWPYADLPDRGDPAPGLADLPAAERAALEDAHVRALVPRWAATAL